MNNRNFLRLCLLIFWTLLSSIMLSLKIVPIDYKPFMAYAFGCITALIIFIVIIGWAREGEK